MHLFGCAEGSRFEVLFEEVQREAVCVDRPCGPQPQPCDVAVLEAELACDGGGLRVGHCLAEGLDVEDCLLPVDGAVGVLCVCVCQRGFRGGDGFTMASQSRATYWSPRCMRSCTVFWEKTCVSVSGGYWFCLGGVLLCVWGGGCGEDVTTTARSAVARRSRAMKRAAAAMRVWVGTRMFCMSILLYLSMFLVCGGGWSGLVIGDFYLFFY